MSHYMTIETLLVDEKAITQAANSLGFIISSKKDCRGYNGQKTKCDLVLNLPGQYDLGFNKTANGYEMVADFWNDHLSKYLAHPDVLVEAQKTYTQKLQNGEWDFDLAEAHLNNAKISKFMQAYNHASIQNLVTEQGLQYWETTNTDGTIVIEILGV